MKIQYIYVHRELTGLCILAKGLSTLYYVQEKFSLTAHCRLECALLYILGVGGPGVTDFVSSLA
jgi:hypothetical protein